MHLLPQLLLFKTRSSCVCSTDHLEDDFLLSHRQLRAEPDAPSRSVKNLRNWFHEAGLLKDGSKANGAIAEQEAEFVNTAGDLVSLVPRSRPPLRRFLDRFAAWHQLILCCCFRVDPVSALGEILIVLILTNNPLRPNTIITRACTSRKRQDTTMTHP